MAVTYAAGASGSISVLGATIAITKWSSAAKYNDVDTTSSKDFDTNSNALYQSQIKTSLGIEFSGEGFLDTANTGYNAANTGLLTALKKRDTPAAVVLAYATNTNYASFNGDVLTHDVEMNVNGAITMKFSGKSNGTITF